MQRVTEAPKPESLNVIALARGPETYIITWTDGQYGAALRTIGRWAADPELSLTWMDACELAERMLSTMRGD